jgi:hypothetical protein
MTAMKLLSFIVLLCCCSSWVPLVDASKGGKKGSSKRGGKGGKKGGMHGGKKGGKKKHFDCENNSGSRDVSLRQRRSLKGSHHHKGDSSDEECDEPFGAPFFIAYGGPTQVFDESDALAIAFLQDAIRDVYNEEIGPYSGLTLGNVKLQSQTLVESESSSADKSDDGDENRVLAQGMTFSLLNSYSASGRCKNCGGKAKLVSNDAVKRRLAAVDSSGIDPVAQFNEKLVQVLTDESRFRTFRKVKEASISNDQPTQPNASLPVDDDKM